jgi:hypothetical protein
MTDLEVWLLHLLVWSWEYMGEHGELGELR